VFATTTYFLNMRPLGILAILAAILAVFFGRAIAGGMGAFVFLVLCHGTPRLSPKFLLYS
jgi:hypothetical protein